MSGEALATYSVVATDSDTQQVGGTATSCVGGLDLSIIYGSAPGRGVIHAQALLGSPGREEGIALLSVGAAPADVIAAIANAGFDEFYQRRQYGVVDLSGRAAGFTGDQTGDYAGDMQGAIGAFVFSVQGNILTSQLVLDQSYAAFRDGGGCDLADRLMLALEAGAQNGEGDSRCTPDQPSDSAFIRVDNADGAVFVSLSVSDLAADPLAELRAEYDRWRAEHPCPGPGTPDASPPPADDDRSQNAGCGCALRGEPTGASAPALLALLVLARRRRRAR
jgi:MYXO-CTERM domain-containing protein